jgi:hypothetical protein
VFVDNYLERIEKGEYCMDNRDGTWTIGGTAADMPDGVAPLKLTVNRSCPSERIVLTVRY